MPQDAKDDKEPSVPQVIIITDPQGIPQSVTQFGLPVTALPTVLALAKKLVKARLAV